MSTSRVRPDRVVVIVSYLRKFPNGVETSISRVLTPGSSKSVRSVAGCMMFRLGPWTPLMLKLQVCEHAPRSRSACLASPTSKVVE